MLQTVLVLGKHFLSLSSSSPCCLPGLPGCTAVGSGSTEAHRAVGTMWLCRPSAASHHKPAHRPGCWGFHNNGKSLSPAFSVEATKRIPIHTKSLSVKGNYRMPKNDNADFILSYTVRATLRLKLQFMLLLPAVKIDLKISIFTI